MLGRKRILAGETAGECQHPDAKLGEVWMTNKPTEGAARYAEQNNLRVGTTAYNKLFAVVSDFQPIFGPVDPGKSHSCQGYCNHKSGGGLKV
jgi:hypothetical protein